MNDQRQEVEKRLIDIRRKIDIYESNRNNLSRQIKEAKRRNLSRQLNIVTDQLEDTNKRLHGLWSEFWKLYQYLRNND